MAANGSTSKSSIPTKSSKSAALPFSILHLQGRLPHITNVISKETYNYYGSLTTELIVEEAFSFLASNSDAEVSDIARALTEFLQITLGDYLDEKALEPSRQAALGTWFTIRMTTPSLEFTHMPRWHRDGRMFNCDVEGDINSKYAITLLGNPTRVLAESDLVREVVADKGHDKSREEYAKRLALETILDIKKGEVIRFSWGQPDSPGHSEPDINSDRVFMSVLYGSEREIRNMCECRHTKYVE